MVNFCAVLGCSNRADRDKKSYFRIPAVVSNQGEQTLELSQRRRNQWLTNLDRTNLSTASLYQYRICSDHFVRGRPASLYDNTNPDWVPSVNLGDNKNAAAAPVPHKHKHRQHKKLLKEHEELRSVQTELTCESVSALQEEMDRLTEENMVLKDELASLTLNEDFFQGDDDRVAFYTGLPSFLVLMHVVSFVSPFLKVTSSFTAFQQVMATLMRCRLNFEVQDLAYRFSVPAPTMAACFRTVVEVLHARIGSLVQWPCREELAKTTPRCFQEGFGAGVAVIVDCFEVLISRPGNLMARVQTWSSRRRRHTVKVLTAATPRGLLLFVSPAWRGRVSDRYLTENCGVTEKLLPGDVVLTGTGLDSAGSVFRTELTPEGKNQLSASEVSDTSKLLDVCLHLQELTARVQDQYTILRGPLDLDFLTRDGPKKQTLVDKVAAVCCALINLSPSVVV